MGKPIDEFSQQGDQKESGCRGDPVDEADVIEPLPVAHVQVDAVRGVAQYLDRTVGAARPHVAAIQTPVTPPEVIDHQRTEKIWNHQP